jgi:hypothetical protein
LISPRRSPNWSKRFAPRLRDHDDKPLPSLQYCTLYDVTSVMSELDAMWPRDSDGLRIIDYGLISTWLTDLRLPASHVAMVDTRPQVKIIATLAPFEGGIEYRQYVHQSNRWRVPINEFVRAWPGSGGGGITAEFPWLLPADQQRDFMNAVVGCTYICRLLADREIEYESDPVNSATSKINARRERLNLPPVRQARRILHLKERKVVHPQVEKPSIPTGAHRDPYDFHKPEWPVTRTLRSGRIVTYVAHRREELLTWEKTKPKPWFKVVP